jgi:hippurate hydrolase
METRIRQLVTSHAEGYGATADIDYVRGYPVLVNSEAETEFARQVAEELVGPNARSAISTASPAARTSRTSCSSGPAVSCGWAMASTSRCCTTPATTSTTTT